MSDANPASSLPKQGSRWQKGQSGNRAGRRPGTRNKVTLMAEKLLDTDAEAIVQAVIAAAKAGDPTAMRLCFERILPSRKGRPVALELPLIVGAADVVSALSAVVVAVASGAISSEEASDLANLIEAGRRAIETAELETRIAALETESDG